MSKQENKVVAEPATGETGPSLTIGPDEPNSQVQQLIERLHARLADLRIQQAQDAPHVVEAMNTIGNYNMIIAAIMEVEAMIATANSTAQ